MWTNGLGVKPFTKIDAMKVDAQTAVIVTATPFRMPDETRPFPCTPGGVPDPDDESDGSSGEGEEEIDEGTLHIRVHSGELLH